MLWPVHAQLRAAVRGGLVRAGGDGRAGGERRLDAATLCSQPATLCSQACNPTYPSLQPYVCIPGGERRLDAAPLRPARAGLGLILAIGLTLVYRIDLRRKL